MAGLFTHFMVCQQAIFDPRLDKKLRQILNANSDWVYFASACPDLPYAMFLGSQNEWADHMHYKSTNGIAIRCREVLRNTWNNPSRLDRIRASWLFGYISHLVVDGTIHPVIEQVVGPYSDPKNRENHKYCEKVQDALIFFECTNGQEINYAEFSDRFDNCRTSHFFNDLMEFWKQLLIDVYPTINPRPEPKQWFTFFRELFDSSDNAGGVVAVFRHAGVGKSLVYSTQKELRRDHRDKCDEYYDNIQLLDGTRGSFPNIVFKKAVDNLISRWNDLYATLQSSDSIATLIPDCDLDTGRKINGSNELIYWSA